MTSIYMIIGVKHSKWQNSVHRFKGIIFQHKIDAHEACHEIVWVFAYNQFSSHDAF